MGAPHASARSQDPLLLQHPVYHARAGWDVLQPHTPTTRGHYITVVHQTGLRKTLSYQRFRRECERGAVMPRHRNVWTKAKRNQHSRDGEPRKNR